MEWGPWGVVVRNGALIRARQVSAREQALGLLGEAPLGREGEPGMGADSHVIILRSRFWSLGGLYAARQL